MTRSVFFLTHMITPPVVRAYQRLASELGSTHEVYFVLHGTASDRNTLLRENLQRSLIVETSELISLPYPKKIDRENFRLIPGHVDLFLQVLAQQIDSEYYWFVEFDVDFSGNWRTLISYFDDTSSADLLGTTFATRVQTPRWQHWTSLEMANDVIAPNRQIRAFFPIYRCSRKMLRLADECYRQGWAGHFETTLPTMCLQYGLSIEDLGGDSEFTKPENVRRFYWNTISNPGLSPGTFVYRPVISRRPIASLWNFGRNFPPNVLWHPVKLETVSEGAYRLLISAWRWLEPALPKTIASFGSLVWRRIKRK